MQYSRAVSLALVVLAPACRNDSSGGNITAPPPPPPTYETVAGTYNGALAGVSQGVTLQSTFTITVMQSAGTLGGTFTATGTLSDGVTTIPAHGAGNLNGTIASGTNPLVNITFTSAVCPNVRDTFSGTYDNASRVITLTGTVLVFDNLCRVILTFSNIQVILRH